MQMLYFDNFRGFDSTFIDLKHINFLVGENSTGKTSVLKLLNVISSRGFWFYQQFTSNETYLGTFQEIISSTRTKEFFELAILSDLSENGRYATGIKLRFVDNNNQPAIKEICFIDNKINLQISVEGKFLKYRFELCSQKKKSIALKTCDDFKVWVKSNRMIDMPFDSENFEYLGIVSILFLLQTVIEKKIPTESTARGNFKLSIQPFLKDIAWLAPIRTEPKRTYDTYTSNFDPEGRHAPYILKDILDEDKENVVKKILRSFGRDSGLLEDVTIRKQGEQNGKNAPFELLIGLNNQQLNIINVGYGISQILPVIIEAIARPEKTLFTLQQPEIHLHPKAQAALGDFIYRSFENDRQKYIIETHSDYIIDRMRLRINRASREKSQSKPEDICQVIFFSRTSTGNKIDIIKIQANGSYPIDQPTEFRDFFIKEQLDLLAI